MGSENHELRCQPVEYFIMKRAMIQNLSFSSVERIVCPVGDKLEIFLTCRHTMENYKFLSHLLVHMPLLIVYGKNNK